MHTTPYTHTLYVSGTHCSACKHLIEETLREQKEVIDAVVSLGDGILIVTTVSHDDPVVLAEKYTELVHEHGYRVHAERPMVQSASREWLYAVPASVLVIVLIVAIDRAGLATFIGGDRSMFTTAFLVGLVASVSTCLAVVGGLVLSVSATYARDGSGWRPSAYFHTGRLVGFFVLGGLLGLLGKVMQIGLYGSALLGIVASMVMLILGVHLLDITKKVRTFSLPATISRNLAGVARQAGPFAPTLLGMVTFFLPCGFTQSMQVVALSSGSFFEGGLTMMMFALGTLPVLALLSFGSLDLAKSRYRGVFFKTAGLLVVAFALFNLQNALAVFGLIHPLITF